LDEPNWGIAMNKFEAYGSRTKIFKATGAMRSTVAECFGAVDQSKLMDKPELIVDVRFTA
jgi:hypothetical protein